MHSGQDYDKIWLYSYLDSHPDERKPPIPYAIGSQFTAIAFDPLNPKDLLESPHDWYLQATDQTENDIRNLHPLQACLRHPPADGHFGNSSVNIRVLDHIRAGDEKNSQILKVEAFMLGEGSISDSPLRHTDGVSSLLTTPTAFPRSAATVAAKLYDPLYVDLNDFRPDPFHNCDAAFALETEAYRDYLRPLYGICVPSFYGSYTINVPIPEDTREWHSGLPADHIEKSAHRTRPVRAMLYEYIPGVALNQAMEDQMYNQSQRKEIMRALVTAESKIRQLDVLIDRDIHPRNVIVVSAEEGHPADIRVIDFGAAQCGERCEDEAHAPTTKPEPISRIIERWRDGDDEWKDPSDLRYPFLDLVDWEWNEWLRHEYAFHHNKTSHTQVSNADKMPYNGIQIVLAINFVTASCAASSCLLHY